MRLQALLAACGGFLLAVLWLDLMFDVQVLGRAAPPAALPDATLASIAHYYARVTTAAHPMQRLIALVMAVTVLGSLVRAWQFPRRLLSWLAFGTAAVPIALAALRVVPNAVRLGSGAGSPAEQSALCTRHLRGSRVLLAGDRRLHRHPDRTSQMTASPQVRRRP
jgi:hypothetical protein